MTNLGVISKDEVLDSSGSIALKLNLKGNFFLSKLPFFAIFNLNVSLAELSKSS